MKNLYYIVFLISILPLTSISQSNNFEKLENLVLKQIESDRFKQDTNYFGTFLRIKNTNTDKRLDLINSIDSTNILHNGGWNFGFYLISKSDYNNNAILTINRRGEEFKLPQELIKCIKHSSDNNDITYYSYYVKEPKEWLNIKLHFENSNPGYAVAGLTIFPVKKK